MPTANDTDSIGIRELNTMKSQVPYLRRVAEDLDDSQMHATATDYRDSADMIERLLAVVGVKPFTAG